MTKRVMRPRKNSRKKSRSTSPRRRTARHKATHHKTTHHKTTHHKMTHHTGGFAMNVRPLRDRVLIKRIEEQEQRIGGIIIPDTAKEKPLTAKVVAIGSGRVNDKGEVFPLDVKVGDFVLVGKYAGTEIKLDGVEYVIVREEEVLGIAEGVGEPELVHA